MLVILIMYVLYITSLSGSKKKIKDNQNNKATMTEIWTMFQKSTQISTRK